MKKTHLIIVNIILLLWYFLSMIGLKIGDKYLVTGAFEHFKVFTKAELEARAEIQYEIYAKAINIEA